MLKQIKSAHATTVDAATRPPYVLAIAAYRFPHGDAMSNRLLQLIRSATPPGATAIVVNDWLDEHSPPPDSPPLPSGVRLITLPPPAGGLTRRILRRATRPIRLLTALRSEGITPSAFTGVYLPLGLWSLTMWFVLRVAVRAPMTVDVMDRHDGAQFRRPWLTAYYLRHRWAWMLAGRLDNQIIAISEDLERHFIGRGRRTLIVPPQVDCSEFEEPSPPPVSAGLRLLYAGSPGAKDLLAVIVEGIRRLPAPDRSRVHLVIAGISREQATSQSDLTDSQLAELSTQITFLGRVSRQRVLDELGTSHFSLLVRPSAGYARAGFPSKVPESLAAGCPVLLNYTSDLARYIGDGREGIVLEGPTPKDVERGLARALRLNDHQLRQMSRAARERAGCFDYQAWAPVVSDFLTGAA
jgi:glycosyltransferase involved in cell wall biosynthesis